MSVADLIQYQLDREQFAHAYSLAIGEASRSDLREVANRIMMLMESDGERSVSYFAATGLLCTLEGGVGDRDMIVRAMRCRWRLNSHRRLLTLGAFQDMVVSHQPEAWTRLDPVQLATVAWVVAPVMEPYRVRWMASWNPDGVQ